ncbi:anion permease [Suttonella ornithocola]|uniref:Inner membrane protein ybhI n=1 Tax=Suttonella ornithocola TaxID=279832 RepID=A0A380MPU0_9GAMM|nr:anion permease [Suttonella ornithocola]SUO93327.1 Inner membrane protein ybhI [Suttonella ornithocola]
MTTTSQDSFLKKYWKQIVFLAIPCIIFHWSPPEGLSLVGWRVFGWYVVAIFGLVAKPWAMPVVLLTAVTGAGVAIGFTPNEQLEMKNVLSGYASTTTWLVFTAFALSTAFVTTGLGKRIAYLMIRNFGHTTLRLGYINTFLDLAISPGMPSVTARGGGIMMPIMNNVAYAIGSEPETSPKKGGLFLLLNTYFTVKNTGYIFITAMAPNALALSLIMPILNIKLNWTQWFLAAAVPGLLITFLTPLVLYLLYKPEVTYVNRQEIAEKGLSEMGAMKTSEKWLLIIFISALIGWITGKWTGINATAVALAAMVACLIVNVITWDNVLQNKGGWNTFIWYGGIIGLSSALTKAGFFKWLSIIFEHLLGGGNIHGGYPMLALILFVSVAIRYSFASGGAYVAAMMPVFATVGAVMHIDPLLLTCGLLFSNAYGGMLTHYGAGPAPIIFGTGYATIKQWWIAGAVIGFGSLVIHLTIGVLWWQMLQNIGLIG